MNYYYQNAAEFIPKLKEARDTLFSMGYELECDAVTQAIALLEKKENADEWFSRET